MAFDKKLLEIIACPVCKGKLDYDKVDQKLICKADKLAYSITEGIPVLIAEKAEQWQQTEEQ
ncbi:MAG: Trm112 family protein [Parashewanella sp.]